MQHASHLQRLEKVAAERVHVGARKQRHELWVVGKEGGVERDAKLLLARLNVLPTRFQHLVEQWVRRRSERSGADAVSTRTFSLGVA